jgi:hypothetical protein
MFKLLIILTLAALLMVVCVSCAHVTYQRASGTAAMMVGTNLVTSSNFAVRVSGWTCMKDFAARGTNTFLGAVDVTSDTDEEAVESSVRGGVEGIGRIVVPKPKGVLRR